MARLSIHLARLQKTAHHYGAGLYRQLVKKNIFLWSQAIAFKVLITIVPVIILATGIMAEILERESTFEPIAAYIRNFIPSAQSDSLLTFLEHLVGAGDTLTIIGVFGLIFSAMTLLTTLRIVVSNVFQEEWHDDRSMIGGYLFDLRMVGQVGILFLLTLVLTIAVQRLNKAGFDVIDGLGLGVLWTGMFNILALLIPFLITAGMFFQLFYFVPKPRPPQQSAWVGALTSAMLWEGAKSSFTLYAQYVGRFERYSGEGAGDVLGSTFGLIIAFVFWAYYSGIVLCLGAVVGLLHEKLHRQHTIAVDTEPAVPAEPEIAATDAIDATPTDQEDAPTPAPDVPTPDVPAPDATTDNGAHHRHAPVPSLDTPKDLPIN